MKSDDCLIEKLYIYQIKLNELSLVITPVGQNDNEDDGKLQIYIHNLI